MEGTKLINNMDTFKTTDLDFLLLKIGSACLFQGNILYSNSSYYEGNNGYNGGALMIQYLYYESQTFTIENSIFTLNQGAFGGAISFGINIRTINGLIQNNYFYQNLAYCKLIFPFQIFLF